MRQLKAIHEKRLRGHKVFLLLTEQVLHLEIDMTLEEPINAEAKNRLKGIIADPDML